MPHKPTIIVLFMLVILLLAGCITSVDPTLPYDELPTITIATDLTLVASPAHPTSYLEDGELIAGTRVKLLGKDEDAAWLLVLHDDSVGWMPVFFSRTNTGNLAPAFIFEPVDNECTKFLGATAMPDEGWIANGSDSMVVLGSIYRPEARSGFKGASLTLTIDGNGIVHDADYINTRLTSSGGIVFFAFEVDGLAKGSEIGFNLANTGNERISFQAAFFEEECAGHNADMLPIGSGKTTVGQPVASQDDIKIAPTPAKTAVIPTPGTIVVQDGKVTASIAPESYEMAVVICNDDGKACDIHLWESRTNKSRALTKDPANDTNPSWSPDGSQFAFISDRTSISQVYIFDMILGQPVQQITQSSRPKDDPKWSPDGNEIAYRVWEDPNWNIWTFDLESLTKQRLTDKGRNSTPSWSPDGRHIAFNASRHDTNNDDRVDLNDSQDIYVMDRDGGNVKKVTDDSNYQDWNPYWMPDGKHLVFSRRVYDKEKYENNGPGEIYIINVDTGDMKPITFSSSHEVLAIPSPSGNEFIILIRSEEDGHKYYTAAWDGDSLGRLSDFPHTMRPPKWRPTGQ